MALEIMKTWKEIDKAGEQESQIDGGKQRMSLEELTEYIKEKSTRSIQEWMERLRRQATAAQAKERRRKRGEISRQNLERVERDREKQATKPRTAQVTQTLRQMLGRESATEKEREEERLEKGSNARKRAKTQCNKGVRAPHQTTQPEQKTGPERGQNTPPRAGGGKPPPKPGRRQA